MRKHGMRPTIRPKNTEKCSSNISMDAVGQWLPGDCCSLKSMIGACQEANSAKSAKLFKSDCKLILGMHQPLLVTSGVQTFTFSVHSWCSLLVHFWIRSSDVQMRLFQSSGCRASDSNSIWFSHHSIPECDSVTSDFSSFIRLHPISNSEPKATSATRSSNLSGSRSIATLSGASRDVIRMAFVKLLNNCWLWAMWSLLEVRYPKLMEAVAVLTYSENLLQQIKQIGTLWMLDIRCFKLEVLMGN